MVVVEPFSVRVGVETSVVEDGVAPAVDLSRPPSRDGNHRYHGGSFAAPQRGNDLNGPVTSRATSWSGRGAKNSALSAGSPLLDLCDGRRR
jgi:hypothetical protein